MRYYEAFPPYVPVSERKLRAAHALTAAAASGQKLSPVQLSGRAIAQSFWGQSWCSHLESYSDFASRLPRGRSYVRGGAVIDLQISGGVITALVQGRRLYTVRIAVKPVDPMRWREIASRCAGGLGSLVELLAGRLSREVMTVVTDRGQGLFPSPTEIQMTCSCPDWATMCKHVAATLYGTGARLDAAPELLFLLRNVDPSELILQAGTELPTTAAATAEVLKAGTDELGALFGIELAEIAAGQPTEPQEVETQSLQPQAAKRRTPRRAAQPAAPQTEQAQVRALKSLLARLKSAEAVERARRER